MSFDSQDPKVSVLMITYNHERYVAQAIESALQQETTFDFEIVIGEDCSTDGTRSIVRDFQRKYPDKIRLLPADRNLGMHRNHFQTLAACSGQYIASLEGDDFWTSPHKLQKQVDFLDSHPDYAICFHNATAFREGAEESSWLYCFPDQKHTSTVEDLLERNFIPTCSVVYRNGLVSDLPEWTCSLKMLDWPLNIFTAQHGYIGYIDETMAAHRMHPGGAYSGLNLIEQQLSCLQIFESLRGRLDSKYDKLIKEGVFRICYDLVVKYTKDNDVGNAEKYARMCLNETTFSSHFVKKIKLMLRLRTPRLFSLAHEFKKLSKTTGERIGAVARRNAGARIRSRESPTPTRREA